MADKPWKPVKWTSDDEYVVCPNCGNRQGDCWEWVTADEKDETCSKCGTVFVYRAEYDVTYYTEVKEDDGTGQE